METPKSYAERLNELPEFASIIHMDRYAAQLLIEEYVRDFLKGHPGGTRDEVVAYVRQRDVADTNELITEGYLTHEDADGQLPIEDAWIEQAIADVQSHDGM